MSTVGGGVSARFTGRLGALDLDVRLEAPTRGITALFGPSGCGKTTTLRCLAGLTRLAGHCRVGPAVWQEDGRGQFRKPHQRAVGYVFQEASLFPHLSVRGNLRFGARRAARRHGPALAEADVVELLGLAPLLARGPGSLSGGERQRVAIGRALLSRPALLLMDEPLSALDAPTRGEILPYLERLHRELALPMVYVSHELSEVARLADRLVVLRDGHSVDSGPLDEVLERLAPESDAERHEAGVVLTARVLAHDDAYHLTRLAHGGHVLSVPRVDHAEGEAVRLRIRARDVTLALQRPSGISVRNILPARVVDITARDGTAFAEARVDIGGTRLRASLTREAVDELGLTTGVAVHALIKGITFADP